MHVEAINSIGLLQNAAVSAVQSARYRLLWIYHDPLLPDGKSPASYRQDDVLEEWRAPDCVHQTIVNNVTVARFGT